MIIHDEFNRPVSVTPWGGVTPCGRCYGNADGLYIGTARGD